MTIHDLDNDSTNFIIMLRSISKDLALWASLELLRGNTLREVKTRLAAAINVAELEKKGI
jgi:hypothetical protein